MIDNIHELEVIANGIRRDIISMVYEAGDGHPGPALSITDILTTLYFDVMNINPNNPEWAERDRLVLSKGHGYAALYAALSKKGYFDRKHLSTLRKLGSILQGHPDMNSTPGVDMTSGSLGNGISIGLGMAMAGRYQDIDNYIYVITGDGELQEGIIWEAAMAAAQFNAGNLIVFVDCNRFQSGGSVDEISSLYPILPKWQGFKWHCQQIDGHDYNKIKNAIAEAKAVKDKPSVIACNTIKGKGIPFIENDNSWHKRVPTKSEYLEAMNILGGLQE